MKIVVHWLDTTTFSIDENGLSLLITKRTILELMGHAWTKYHVWSGLERKLIGWDEVKRLIRSNPMSAQKFLTNGEFCSLDSKQILAPPHTHFTLHSRCKVCVFLSYLYSHQSIKWAMRRKWEDTALIKPAQNSAHISPFSSVHYRLETY